MAWVWHMIFNVFNKLKQSMLKFKKIHLKWYKKIKMHYNCAISIHLGKNLLPTTKNWVCQKNRLRFIFKNRL